MLPGPSEAQEEECGSSQVRRGQEASPGLPRFQQCLPARTGPQEPCPAFPSLLQPAQCPGALTSCPASPGNKPYVQGPSGTFFQVLQGPGPSRTIQDHPGLFRTVQDCSSHPRGQEGPSGLPWLPRKLPDAPQDFGPLRGSEKCFYGHFMLCIFSIGTALDIYFILFCEHVKFCEVGAFHRK